MDNNDIKALLQVGERITFECKKAEDSIPKSVWETYSSFANTIGGTILLGITENLKEINFDKRFYITGVKNPKKMKKDFFDTLNSNKVNRNILTDEDVDEVVYEGHTLLYIKVPQADYRQRPIYINDNMMNGSFKRNYEGDYHCTEDDVKAMIRDANDSGNDGVLMENFTMDDIDKNTLNAYRNRFRTANQDHVWNDYNDKEFLINMGGYVIDRNTSREGLTLAGLLMFGKGLPIRERFDNIRMDYLDLTNLQPDSRWSDRLTYDGRWENNLYNFFTRVQSKLVNDIKRPFRLEGMERVDDTPVHKAVREALTNLIIHSDYMMTGILKIEKRNDCFVFSNPGSLKLPIMEIYAGGHSKARNPNMQAMLRMIGFGDNIGSGFPTILSAWKKENWRKPILIEKTDLHLVELTLSMESFITEECSNNLKKLFGNSYINLQKEEQLILATAIMEDSVSNYYIQLLLDKNPLEVGKLLYSLVYRDLLISTNKGRWTTYTINYDYIQGVESRSKSQGVESRSKSQGVESRDRKKKELINKIILYCQEPRTLQEIATYMGYSDRYRMKKEYINPLLGNYLQMTLSESKTAPTQQYIAIH
ncbi:MAG: AAA family ATPase [Bacteroidia bacterium]|nr:AAA family ATPase [Bacteroidia bacterium]